MALVTMDCHPTLLSPCGLCQGQIWEDRAYVVRAELWPAQCLMKEQATSASPTGSLGPRALPQARDGRPGFGGTPAVIHLLPSFRPASEGKTFHQDPERVRNPRVPPWAGFPAPLLSAHPGHMGIVLPARLRTRQPGASPRSAGAAQPTRGPPGACCRDPGPVWTVAGAFRGGNPLLGKGHACAILRDFAKLPSAEVTTLCNNAGASSSPHSAGERQGR